MADAFENFTMGIARFFSTVTISDVVDIAVVAFLIFQVYKLVRETRAQQLIKGVLVIVLLLQLSYWFKLNTMQYILEKTVQLGFFAVLVVFQPELRRALEHMGRGTAGKLFRFTKHESEQTEKVISEVVRAVERLSADKTGALICIERITKLGDIIATGVPINGDVTSELLVNIFVPNTPLHDGAVIIGSEKLLAAACFLPLTHNNDLSKELGTRHRAAIGLSENSDAFVIVVSEETGKISMALNGGLTRNLTPLALKKALRKTLLDDLSMTIKKNKIMFWKEDKNEEDTDE